jgi:two-component system sensor histidine kinase BaeS
MKARIRHKLFLTLLSTAVAVTLCMFLVMRWSFDRGFLGFVSRLETARLGALAQRLETEYARNGGSWRFVQENPAAWDRLLAEYDPERRFPSVERHDGDPPGPPRPRIDTPFPGRIALFDAGGARIAGGASEAGGMTLRPLRSGTETVGRLGILPPRLSSGTSEGRFALEQRQAFALIAVTIIVLAGFLSIPLSRQMARRIGTLADGTHRLASGDYKARVPEGASDELGRLARDFNALAKALEDNEAARRRWVADISHELRTPLSVLRGEIEALQDGVRPVTPQAIAMLHGEAMRLGRLVDDLYELSLSDIGALTYRKAEADLAGLLTDSVEAFRSDFAERGLALETDIHAAGRCVAFVDPDRVGQLFANLLSNALRYTDRGGAVRIALTRKGREAVVRIEDSAPGVPEGEIPRLFERLYRGESSRSRETGGAGLGLSICRNVVEAHGGRIDAAPSPMGGLRVTVVLPLEA